MTEIISNMGKGKIGNGKLSNLSVGMIYVSDVWCVLMLMIITHKYGELHKWVH